MNIIVARNAGFCFGVNVPLKQCMNILEGRKTVYLRPIIHNHEVVGALSKEGVIVEDDIEHRLRYDHNSFSWGSGYVYNRMIDKGLDVVDATCPYVKKSS